MTNTTAQRIALLNSSPLWAMMPDAIAAFVAGSWRAEGWEAAKPSIQGKGPNKIAVIPIQGVLTKDGPSYYGSNYDTISNAVESAAADPDVKHIVLSVDSPGGDVAGLQETAAIISAAAKAKPVHAMVDTTAASAAYYLASQASDISLTPSGEVGSVGVRMMHVDISKMLEDNGYKVTELSAGYYKTEWSPYKPLSEEAIATMQPRLDAMHSEFIGAVAAGRGTRATAEITAQRFGEGRMFGSSDAATHGLVDKIQSSRDFFRAIAPAPETPQTFGFERERLEIAKARR